MCIRDSRQTLRVPRPVGEGMRRKALYRIRSVQRLLKAAGRDGQGAVERIVGVGAALEMLAGKPRWWRRSTVRQRWYITDTEVNHLAHRLARKAATHVVVPTHWRADLDGGFLASFKGQIHRLDGLHGHVHLAPQRRPSKVSSPPRILVRRLEGGGVHDDGEIVALPEDALDGVVTTLADENAYEGDAWALDRELATHDGVITQSVTLAVRRRFWEPQPCFFRRRSVGSLTVWRLTAHRCFDGLAKGTRSIGVLFTLGSWRACT